MGAAVCRACRLPKGAFCAAGLDLVGLREVAAVAGADPAIVVRLFGSKESLFQVASAEVVEIPTL